MIFKTYIFEYFKVEIVDHSLGLLIWVFGVCIAFFTSDGKRLCKHFLSIAQSRNMEYWKQIPNFDIAKQEGNKMQNRKISFESFSCRFLLVKA